MLEYRLYLIGRASHVESVRDILASDDAAAMEAAANGPRAERMELWCGPRFVADWAFGMPTLPTRQPPSLHIVRPEA